MLSFLLPNVNPSVPVPSCAFPLLTRNRCPIGLFTFAPNSAECTVCGANFECPGGATVWPDKGFWHSAPRSIQMHRWVACVIVPLNWKCHALLRLAWGSRSRVAADTGAAPGSRKSSHRCRARLESCAPLTSPVLVPHSSLVFVETHILERCCSPDGALWWPTVCCPSSCNT
jgi:hypothetical protein